MKKILAALGVLAGVIFYKFIKKEIPENENELFAQNQEDKKSVNVNRADFETLMEVPGIGPDLSDKIIEYRKQNGNFNEMNELMNVKGIGNKKLDEIKPYLSL